MAVRGLVRRGPALLGRMSDSETFDGTRSTGGATGENTWANGHWPPPASMTIYRWIRKTSGKTGLSPDKLLKMIIWYHIKRFCGTKCVLKPVLCIRKRFMWYIIENRISANWSEAPIATEYARSGGNNMPACKYEYAFRILHKKQKKTDTLLGKGCLLLFVIHYLNNALQRYNSFHELQTNSQFPVVL